MKLIKAVMYLVLILFLFVVAGFSLVGGLMALDEQFTGVLIHTFTQLDMPGLFIAAGFICFLLSLVIFGFSGRGNSQPATISFEGEKGPISVSLRAIEDYITKYLDGQHLANSVKTRVSASRNRQNLIIRASISVWSEQKLKNVGDTVQREIAARLRDGLGLDNIERVIVSVDKIITSKSSRPSLPGPAGDSLA